MKLLHGRLKGQDGHTVGRKMLASFFDGAMPEIAYTKLGKPYFEGSDLHFSISHTPKHTFCVVSDRPVGIDAEERDRKINLRLAEKILSEKEYAQFQQAEDKNKALLTFWVLKEAAGKCTGEGVKIYPNHTDFSLADPRVQEIDGCVVAVIEDL